MGRLLAFVSIALCVFPCRVATGARWYVDGSVSESGDGKSWETAFKRIQEGIDAAGEGDTVVVAEGTYLENIRFEGKNIVLTSTDPFDPEVAAKTIIDGNEAGPVVTFIGWENWRCMLTGFTIRNGLAEEGGGVRGGTEHSQCHASIQNNTIVENSADGDGGGLAYCDGLVQGNMIAFNSAFGDGGGLAHCNGLIRDNAITDNAATHNHGGGLAHCGLTIENNTVTRNLAYFGGGLAHCDGLIQDNAIIENSASPYGGGLAYCNGTIQGNVIEGNAAGSEGGGVYACDGTIQENAIRRNSAYRGGGMFECSGTIQNNMISENSAEFGGGLAHCFGTVLNNLISDNSAARAGGGLYSCGGTIQNNTIAGNSAYWGAAVCYGAGGVILNCIVWGNAGWSQHQDSPIPRYSCVEGWAGGGEGNMGFDPYFVDPEGGDFHLIPWSPCIDAGDPASRFSNEPEPNGGRVNMGAYGNTSGATSKSLDSDADGLPDDWETRWFGDLDEDGTGDSDGDGISNIVEYRYGWDPGMAAETLVENLTKGLGYQCIQSALGESDDGDEIVVYPGLYPENIDFGGKNVVVHSIDPSDADVVVNTIIDGGASGSVVRFSGTEDETCTLAGFTIRNGSAENGGGIEGAWGDDASRATIRQNVIVGNVALALGGGLFKCSGTIQENTISGNRAGRGGGLAYCDGTIANNIISDNSSGRNGGALQSCGGTIENNVIARNSAEMGGGLCGCDGTIRGNVISENSARDFGGGLYFCRGVVVNNIIFENSAQQGGGLHACPGTIGNNTIVGNSALGEEGCGGGLSKCFGSIRNCIIWGNMAWQGGQMHGSSQPTFSCVEHWSGGEGNIAFTPYFVDAEKGDFHLRSWSPCIDAGDPISSFSEEPEPHGGRINMGAFGNTPEATTKSPDTDTDELPDDWEMFWFGNLEGNADADPDTDGIPNLVEYRYGWDPTTAALTLVENVTKGVAYQMIQPALWGADDGDEIVVHPGVYRENIHFGGKKVVVRSIDPVDPEVVGKTIVDGGGAGSVVTFSGTEDGTCVLSGFTLRNGSAFAGGAILGGTMSQHTHATIGSNAITGNKSTGYDAGGGALAYCDGVVSNNVITGNAACGEEGCGGGLYMCHGTIQDNAIAGNSAANLHSCGGGLAYCNGMVRNNVVSDNRAEKFGGGLAYCDGTIQNNVIRGNSAPLGGGVSHCRGPIENNNIVGNSARNYGGGFYYCLGTIRNCIVWGNRAWRGAQLYMSTEPAYSCIALWTGGQGNIAHNPHFVDPGSGDFHLNSWSPCIDAGDPSSPFLNELEPNGGRVNMGAYGNTKEATCKSPDAEGDGLPDDWELRWFGNLDGGTVSDPDGDGIRNGTEYRFAWDPTTKAETLVEILVEGQRYETIQAAIGEARDGDEIVVHPGVYRENIVFPGKSILLRSTTPSDAKTVADTIIDGNGFGSVVTFSGAEDETCVLTGFTIRNGNAPGGGGICGMIEEHRTRATIRNNVITGNVAALGGGLYVCDGTIEDNTICGNSADSGGGMYLCEGLIRRNKITGNAASEDGGGLHGCHDRIENNLIVGNSAGGTGGGLDHCRITIYNNTIVGNSAVSFGGGLYRCEGTIRNCIVWGNTAAEGAQLWECAEPEYCCIQGRTGDEEGNIGENPWFADAENGNHRLVPGSPCIDAGFNDPGLPETDIRGMHRIMYGGKSLTVDMGAYEYYVNAIEIADGVDVTLTWSSLAEKRYTVYFAADMVTWEVAADGVPSTGDTVTTWLDPGAILSPGVAGGYYRIIENR